MCLQVGGRCGKEDNPGGLPGENVYFGGPEK